MKLIVHSKHTKKYINDFLYDKTLITTHTPDYSIKDVENTEKEVIAIGGGSVIDTAKILSKNPIIAIPTTLSGACRTTHSVYWKRDRKCNAYNPKPITISKPEYMKTLPKEFLEYSRIDAVCHGIESLISKDRTTLSKFLAKEGLNLLDKNNLTDLLNGSYLTGDAMEITKTNVIHALSYPITYHYKVPHGKALVFLLPKILPYYGLENLATIKRKITLNIDTEKIIKEALTYYKIFKTRKKINKDILRKLLQ